MLTPSGIRGETLFAALSSFQKGTPRGSKPFFEPCVVASLKWVELGPSLLQQISAAFSLYSPQLCLSALSVRPLTAGAVLHLSTELKSPRHLGPVWHRSVH